MNIGRGRDRRRFRNTPRVFIGNSYDADFQAWADTVLLVDDAYIVPINQFYLDLKAASLYTKKDRLWLTANKDATAALTCLKSLAVMTPVNAPVFTSGRGYAGNGSSSYLNTGFIPSTHGVQYLQNSAHIGFYSRTSGGTNRDMGCDSSGGGPTVQLIANFGDNAAYGRINSAATLITVANANASGLFSVSRTGAGALSLYREGLPIQTGATASTGRPNNEMLLCCINNAGTAGSPSPTAFTTRQYALASIGAGRNDAEEAAYKTCVDTLKAAIGF
jgi:hypothetical protein